MLPYDDNNNTPFSGRLLGRIGGHLPTTGYNPARVVVNPNDPDYLKKLALIGMIEGQHELSAPNLNQPEASASTPTKAHSGPSTDAATGPTPEHPLGRIASPQATLIPDSDLLGSNYLAPVPRSKPAATENAPVLGAGAGVEKNPLGRIAGVPPSIAVEKPQAEQSNDPFAEYKALEAKQAPVLGLMQKARGIHNRPLKLLGEIGAGLATGGEALGESMFPSVAVKIPGSMLNLEARRAGAFERGLAEQKLQEEQERDEIALGKAGADKTPFTYAGPNGEPETGFTDKFGNKYDKSGIANPNLTAFQHGTQGELTDADVSSLNNMNESNWAANFPGQPFPKELLIAPGSSQAVIKSVGDSLKQRYAQQAQTVTAQIEKKFPVLVGEYPPPDPSKYSGGAADPGYQAAQRAWAKQIDRINQAQQMALAQARGAGFELERPIPITDPDTGATLGEWVPGSGDIKPAPGQTRESVLDAIGNGGLAAKLPGATLGRQAAARAAIAGAKNLDQDIPKYVKENPDIIGNLPAIVNSILQNTPLADPVQNRLAGELKSFAAQQGAAHGMRGQGVLEEFLRGLTVVKNQKALTAYIDGISRGLEPIANTGVAGGRNAGVPSSKAGGSTNDPFSKFGGRKD
jgi:hypothetical protein